MLGSSEQAGDIISAPGVWNFDLPPCGIVFVIEFQQDGHAEVNDLRLEYIGP